MPRFTGDALNPSLSLDSMLHDATPVTNAWLMQTHYESVAALSNDIEQQFDLAAFT